MISKEPFAVLNPEDILQLLQGCSLHVYNPHMPVSLQRKAVLTVLVGARAHSNQRTVWVIGRLGLQPAPSHAKEE